MSSEPPWLILTHTHPLFRVRIHQEELMDALPEAARHYSVNKEIVSIGDSERPRDVRGIDWEEARDRQAQLFREEVEPRLDQFMQRRIGYFGATYIPLALDLGFRLGDWRRIDVFQHNPTRHHWRWDVFDEQTVSVEIGGAPQDPLELEGDAIIRVSTSYGIADAQVREVVSGAIADIRIGITEPGRTALRSPRDIAAVVEAFQSAIETLLRNRPGTRRIHLFLAGPVGLSLRIGAAIPTTCPPVVCYNFTSGADGGYVRTFELSATHRGAGGVAPRTPTNVNPRTSRNNQLLFLAAQPRNLSHLSISREHDEVIRRVEAIPERPFGIRQRLATQVTEIQDLIDSDEFSMLHFSGHGNVDGGLFLERSDGMATTGSLHAISELFRLASDEHGPLDLVVLNACHSHLLARTLVENGSVRAAIGMSDEINDNAAILFADGFYRRLAAGGSPRSAYHYGQNRVRLDPRMEHQAELPQFFEQEQL